MKAFLLLILIGLSTVVHSQQQDTIRVFYLGGQSNMDGFGYTKDLPKDLAKAFRDVYIFHGNPTGDAQVNGGVGIWAKLKPGHGTNFSSDSTSNKLSKRFGMELSFARRLKELYPNDKIALIKYSKGGSSIDSMAARQFGCWEPDYLANNQYNNFLNTINNAFAQQDINSDGITDILIPSGIIWMQGESDADCTEAIAKRYDANLKRLMDLIRASLRDNNIPIVIGKISDSWNDASGKVWTYGELVQYAQEKFVRNDQNAAIIRDTRFYKYSDPWHYNSEGYIHLGQRFADEIYQLIQP